MKNKEFLLVKTEIAVKEVVSKNTNYNARKYKMDGGTFY